MIPSGVIIDEKFEIQEFVGSGGFAEIYAVRQRGLDRRCALKLLHRERDCLDDETLARFTREARILCTLNHPNIASFYSFGMWRNQPYIVMEFADGCSLASTMATRGYAALPIADSVHIAIQICAGLQQAHAAGVIHRDLSASNVILVPDGEVFEVKLIDFGLAKFHTDASRNIVQTDVGQALGSVLFMSPEQCVGHTADQRSDLYSLGCILYFCLTGSYPFSADSSVATMYMQVSNPAPELPVHDETTRRLAAIISRCLQKLPAHRYDSALEVQQELLEIQGGLSEYSLHPRASHQHAQQLEQKQQEHQKHCAVSIQDAVERLEGWSAQRRTVVTSLFAAILILGAAFCVVGIDRPSTRPIVHNASSIAAPGSPLNANFLQEAVLAAKQADPDSAAPLYSRAMRTFLQMIGTDQVEEKRLYLSSVCGLLPVPHFSDADLELGKQFLTAANELGFAKKYEQALGFATAAQEIFATKKETRLAAEAAISTYNCFLELHRYGEAEACAAQNEALLTEGSGSAAQLLSIASFLKEHSQYLLAQRYLEAALRYPSTADLRDAVLMMYCALISRSASEDRLASIDQALAKAAAQQVCCTDVEVSATALSLLASCGRRDLINFKGWFASALASVPAAGPRRSRELVALAEACQYTAQKCGWSFDDPRGEYLRGLALTLFKRASGANENDPAVTAQINSGLGDLYLELKEKKAALDAYEKASRILGAKGVANLSSSASAHLCTKLAQGFSNLGRNAQAEAFWRRALAGFMSRKNVLAATRSEIELSRCLRSLHRAKEAEDCDRNALQRLEREEPVLGADRDFALFLDELGQNLVEGKAFSEAENVLEKATRAYQKANNKTLAARCTRELGDTYKQDNRQKDAVEAYQRGASYLRAEPQLSAPDPLLALEMNLLARSLRSCHRLHEAESLYARALAEYAQMPLSFEGARCEIEQGECLEMGGRNGEALVHFKRAVAQLQTLKTAGKAGPEETADYYFALAGDMAAAQDLAAAIPLYREALQRYITGHRLEASARCRAKLDAVIQLSQAR